MTSGGARTRSGPPPDPGALARDRRTDAAWTVLPAEGRKGELPEWPLSKPVARELHWWAWLWSRPQATQWERLGQQVEVALYARRLTASEARNAPVALVSQVRQLADNLGLTIPGMLRLRWKLSVNEVADKRAERAAEEPTPSVRDRFRVVG